MKLTLLFRSLAIVFLYLLPYDTFALTSSNAREQLSYQIFFADQQHGMPASSCRSQMCRHLKGLIDASEESIDFAIYGVRKQRCIIDALVAAKKRGVKIRGVVDTKNRYCGNAGDYTYSDTKQLIAALGGKPSIHCDNGKGYQYVMHNKFFIFDRKQVWTGSANISDAELGGEYHANVSLTLDSSELAFAYLHHFEKLFQGGFHDKSAQLLSYKQDWQDGSQLELYFSPRDDTLYTLVIPKIAAAKHSIKVAMFFLTHEGVAEALIAAHRRGVKVQLILDATGAAHPSSVQKKLCQEGLALKIENWGSKMHMKMAIIDGEDKENAGLIMGSQNWTHNASNYNDENTLYIRQRSIVEKANKEFGRLWQDLAAVPYCQLIAAEGNPSSVCVDKQCVSQCLRGACCDGLDNDHDGRIDQGDSQCYDASPLGEKNGSSSSQAGLATFNLPAAYLGAR